MIDKSNAISIYKILHCLEEPYKEVFTLRVFGELSFKEIADISLARKTGARGLRAIIEEIMGDVMYEIPSEDTITRVIVTKDAVSDSKNVLVEREEATGTEG